MSDNSYRKTGGVSGTGDKVLLCVGLSCCCIIFGLIATFITYLGIYAFNNPDPKACYFIEGNEVGYATKVEAIVAAGLAADIEPVNVHDVYVGWFAWMFWTVVIPLMSLPIGFIISCMRIKFLTQLYSLVFGGGALVSSLLAIIFGTIWRMNSMGDACTRDAIPKGLSSEDKATYAEEHGLQSTSGAFIATFLIIFYSIFVLSCCTCCFVIYRLYF